MNELVAYSSVRHRGFVVLGIFSFTPQGLDGAVFQMLAHGISTGALFALVGMLYERRHSLEIKDYGGGDTGTPRRRALAPARVSYPARREPGPAASQQFRRRVPGAARRSGSKFPLGGM